ncbi:MAG: pyridoxal kinase PdxY [Alphaproteobacteria bacterium]
MSILSIQSHVAYGHVGNAAAVFPLQRLGFEVWPVHTVQFSNHLGYGDWQGQVFSPEHIAEIIDGVAARGVLDTCAAVLSGFLGAARLGQVVADTVDRVRAANPSALYLCDPVMGDTGTGFYVHDDIPEFLRTRALPLADIITPNLFELEHLAQCTIVSRNDTVTAARKLLALGPSVAIVTSLHHNETPADAIDILAVTADDAWQVRTPYLPLDPAANGAGDALAALFLGHYLKTREVPAALAKSSAAIFAIISATKTAGTRELQLIAAQDEMVRPSRHFPVERI